jgi:photosystem II stability/assembly factor-like uncharacterized protein
VGVSLPFLSSDASLNAVQVSGPLIRAQGVTEMQQLAPGVGWALSNGRLLWTSNGGSLWGDITPQGLIMGSWHSIFFLDAAHAWIVTVANANSEASDANVTLFRTEDSGQTWQSIPFELISHPDLKTTEARPKSVFFVDSRRGWFLWRNPTSSAFSSGKMLATEDGGISWKELPDPPAATAFRFHTPVDGWMAGGAGGDDLWVTQDGGQTWRAKSVTPPSNCSHCRPMYDVPRFQSPNSAALAITFLDQQAQDGRVVNTTYVTEDGGNSWRLTESYEQAGPYPKAGITSSLNTQAIRVFSDPQHGIQVRMAGNITNSSYPKGLPTRGFITSAQFVDDSNGWFVYQAYTCNKFRNPSADGPGLPCLDGVRQNDLLTTADGGKSFKVMTLPAPPGSSQ